MRSEVESRGVNAWNVRRTWSRRAVCGAAFACTLSVAVQGPAAAETLNSALARAYHGNPDLNQTRASVRARDEDAPKALAGQRPKASITATAGPEFATIRIPAGRNNFGQRSYYSDIYTGKPRGAALNVSQTLFDGGRTENSVRQANPPCSPQEPDCARANRRCCSRRRPPI